MFGCQDENVELVSVVVTAVVGAAMPQFSTSVPRLTHRTFPSSNTLPTGTVAPQELLVFGT